MELVAFVSEFQIPSPDDPVSGCGEGGVGDDSIRKISLWRLAFWNNPAMAEAIVFQGAKNVLFCHKWFLNMASARFCAVALDFESCFKTVGVPISVVCADRLAGIMGTFFTCLGS